MLHPFRITRPALLLALVFSLIACTKQDHSGALSNNDGARVYRDSRRTIQMDDIASLSDGVHIGEKLVNPYSFSVMKAAFESLDPRTKSELDTIDHFEANYLYIRILPTDSAHVDWILASEYDFFNYPLDYEILGDPDEYHDPSIPEDAFSWQYTVIPIDNPLPPMEYDILDVCFIPDSYETGPSGQNAMNELERRAFSSCGYETNRGDGDPPIDWEDDIPDAPEIPENGGGLSGNGTSMSDANNLRGIVRVYDNYLDSLIPLKGVEIRTRVFVKVRHGYTDDQGFYSITNDSPATPSRSVRYKNIPYGFTIGYGFQYLMHSGSTDLPSEIYNITRDVAGQKNWILATINNAAYDWFQYCNQSGITSPPNDLRIWAMTVASGAGALMLHHGVYDFTNLSLIVSVFLGLGGNTGIGVDLMLRALIRLILPDITLMNSDELDSSSLIYKSISHELSHASHFQTLGNTDISRSFWWSAVFDYELANLVASSFQNPYGENPGLGSGPCGVAEMWAHAMGPYMVAQHTNQVISGDDLPSSPYLSVPQVWFKPRFIWDLARNEHLTPAEVFSCMAYDVDNIGILKERLISTYPAKAAIIDSIYAKY